MTKGSDLLVAALANQGVERIFGVFPGEENLDVVGVASKFKNQAYSHAPRAGRGFHGGNARSADRAYAHLGAIRRECLTS
jgi:hypothetical protein